MKNKNALYIVLGIGAGVVAYYIFCKKKDEVEVIAKSDEKPKDKPTPSKGVSGGGFTPIIAPILTPIATTPVATTPIVVNITKPAITKADATLFTKPVTSPVTSPVTPTAITRPTTTAPVLTQPVIAPVSASATSLKVGFDGGQQCFEVGECLTDL